MMVGEGEDWKDVAVPGAAGAPAPPPSSTSAQPAFTGGSGEYHNNSVLCIYLPSSSNFKGTKVNKSLIFSWESLVFLYFFILLKHKITFTCKTRLQK